MVSSAKLALTCACTTTIRCRVTCYSAVREALTAKFAHIDTSATYENYAAVGAAIADSGIDRAAVWVTVKLNGCASSITTA